MPLIINFTFKFGRIPAYGGAGLCGAPLSLRPALRAVCFAPLQSLARVPSSRVWVVPSAQACGGRGVSKRHLRGPSPAEGDAKPKRRAGIAEQAFVDAPQVQAFRPEIGLEAGAGNAVAATSPFIKVKLLTQKTLSRLITDCTVNGDRNGDRLHRFFTSYSA